MLKLALRHGARLTIAFTVVGVLTLGGLILGLRYGLMPRIESYRHEIAAAVSRQAGLPVAIGGIRANWDGLHPQLELLDVKVSGPDGQTALELVRVEAALSWRSLLVGGLRLSALDVYQPNLEVRRDAQGKIFVAGLPVGAPAEGSGFVDWLLAQRDVVIHNAVVAWEDDLRGLPPVALDNLSLQLQNRGRHHRFGLAASLPAELSGRLILRGDLEGDSAASLAGWRGRLYAEIPYADAVAWRRHVPVPELISGGRGALRVWLDFSGAKVESVFADVKLANVAARFDPALPPLDLTTLAGRIHYRALGEGFEVGSERLALTTRPQTLVGPMDFLLRLTPAGGGRPPAGEFRASRVELAAVAALLRHLPVGEGLRKRVAELTPSGLVRDLALTWAGETGRLERYSANGRIERLSLRPQGTWPGVSGVSAEVEGDERAGRIRLSVRDGALEAPAVFAEALALSSAAGEIGWRRGDAGLEVAIQHLEFANADLAGSAQGSWRGAAQGAGRIDLEARLSRGEAAATARYVPLLVPAEVRRWLGESIQAGNISQANLKLQGDLAEFPFVDERRGLFLVEASLDKGVLRYAPDWPALEGIAADLTFRGPRMEIRARQATTLGVPLTKVSARIADLGAAQPLLQIAGESSGPVAGALGFVNASPLKARLGALTQGLTASGNGHLDLKLSLPLAGSQATRVRGAYQLRSATLALPGVPPLTDIDGTVSFTEDGPAAERIAARLLGGPVTLGVRTRSGAVEIRAEGAASAAAVKAAAGAERFAGVQGSTHWRGSVTLSRTGIEAHLESPLTGVSSTLPEPLGKREAETLPLAVDYREAEGERDSLRIALGEVFSAALDRPAKASHWTRGAVSFGRPAQLPAEDGLWLAGNLAGVDLDRWRALIAGGDGGGLALAGVDVRVASAQVFDRVFTDLGITARLRDGEWRGRVESPAVAGEFQWKPAGDGLLLARLARLFIPEERQTPATSPPEVMENRTPALDITADDLRVKGRRYGRIELKAAHLQSDWRIEHLRLSEADAELAGQGVWSRGPQPRTQMKLTLKAPDAGRLLASLGFPGTVRGGECELVGDLNWPGAPYEMQPARLSGDLRLSAKNGQFLKAEPGVGRLLGLMSLQSLPRRVSFDFSDLFSQGFSFDSLGGTMKIASGVISTSDFALSGPSAKVHMAGQIDLARETQDLKVKVTPTLSEGVSLGAGFLAGPVVGLSALLVQKMLGNPIEKGFTAEYSVTGTWDNPTVARLGLPSTEPKPKS